jgi:hypothetical protein
MRYNAAIIINPHWDGPDKATAKRLLLYRIAKETQTDEDIVAKEVVFEERDEAFQKLLVASFEVRQSEPRIVWQQSDA